MAFIYFSLVLNDIEHLFISVLGNFVFSVSSNLLPVSRCVFSMVELGTLAIYSGQIFIIVEMETLAIYSG